MNLIDLDILDSEQVEEDNPFINIAIDGEEIRAIILDYLYSLPKDVVEEQESKGGKE